VQRDESGGAPRRIVITGSECTGKTTLARALARDLGAILVPEFARAYAESKAGPLGAADVEPIARGQIRAEDEAIERARAEGNPLLVLDTDLVSTTVYARHYYGACPPWIDEAALARRGDLYLMCDVDVPWVSDAARDRPHHRDEIHAMFVDALERLGARWAPVRGLGDVRVDVARGAVRGIVRAAR
jgi:NadR type nicotinamide-nucleotide adenylyltransferase